MLNGSDSKHEWSPCNLHLDLYDSELSPPYPTLKWQQEVFGSKVYEVYLDLQNTHSNSLDTYYARFTGHYYPKGPST